MKKRLKEISVTVMNALNRMNKLEMIVRNKLSKMEALPKSVEHVGAIKTVTRDVREQIKTMREIQTSVQDLYGKIMRIYDSGKIGWDRLQNVSRDISEMEKLRNDLQDLRRIVEWLVNKEEKKLI